MAQSVKLGLLGNGISRSRAKNLHELLGTCQQQSKTDPPYG